MSRRLPFLPRWSEDRPHIHVSGLAWAALLLVPAAAILVFDQAFSLLLAQGLPFGQEWAAGSLGPFGVERLDHADLSLRYVAVVVAILVFVVLIRPYVSRAVRIPITLAAAVLLGSQASLAVSLARTGVVHDFLTVRTTDADPLGWLARTIASGNGDTMHMVPADLAYWAALLLVGVAVAVGVCEQTVSLAKRALPLAGRRGALMIAITVAMGIGGLTIGVATAPVPHQGLELTATSIDANGGERVLCTAEAAPGEPVVCAIPFGGVR